MTKRILPTTGAKGQSMAIDTMSAILIFLLVSGSLTWVWTTKAIEAENLLYESEIEIMAERAIDTLIRSTGLPKNWEKLEIDAIEVIGLAKRDRILEEEKINKFFQLAREYKHHTQVQGFWKFDTDPTVSIEDSGKYGNHATCAGTACPTQINDRGSVPDSAYFFDGTNDYVDLQKLDITGNQMTIAAWFRKDGGTGDKMLISKATGSTDSGTWWMLGVKKTGMNTLLMFKLKINDNTEALYDTSADGVLGNIAPGQWTHAAAVYNGNRMTLYKNGVQVESMNVSGSITPNPAVDAFIGTNPPGSRRWWGAIDEVVILNRALSEEEIMGVYTNGIVLGNYEETRQKFLIGASDYYFRLLDPEPGTMSEVIETGVGSIEIGIPPDETTILQTTIRRPVTFTYHREGEDTGVEKSPHPAIAEITLHTSNERRRR